AVEQREERASGRVRPHDAAGEERRYTGAVQRLLEQRLVPLGVAQQDGAAIERRAFPRRGEEVARDLHALGTLAGRGEETETGVERRGWGRGVGLEDENTGARYRAGA